MLTPQQVQDKVKEYSMTKPGMYIVPEPPRGDTIRIYDKFNMPPFTLVGPQIEWRSLATRLDLTKNYWEKTPITTEHLFLRDLWMFLVPEHHIKYFQVEPFVHVGPALFAEDQVNREQLQLARERYQDIIASLISDFETRLVESLAGITERPVKQKKPRKPRKPKVPVNEPTTNKETQ